MSDLLFQTKQAVVPVKGLKQTRGGRRNIFGKIILF